MSEISITVAISVGELLDKISILELKYENFRDSAKLANVKTELEMLRQAFEKSVPKSLDVSLLRTQLGLVNRELWNLEKEIRLLRTQGVFDKEFVDIVLRIQDKNRERAQLKYQINEITNSLVVEEKDYDS